MNDTTNLRPVVGNDNDYNQNIYDDIKISSDDMKSQGVIILPSNIPTFIQTSLPTVSSITRNYGNGKCVKYINKTVYNIEGNYLDEGSRKDLYCPICGNNLSNNGTSDINLNHLPTGDISTKLIVNAYQSGFLKGTTPTYETYMQLKKNFAAVLA